MSKEIKIGKVKDGMLFIYNGKKYQYIRMSEGWKQLCDENGNPISAMEIPNDILLNRAMVEIVDE